MATQVPSSPSSSGSCISRRARRAHIFRYSSHILLKAIDGSQADRLVFEDALLARRIVFTGEQGVSTRRDRDGKDASAFHIVAYEVTDTVGTNRALTLMGAARMRKVMSCGVLHFSQLTALIERVCTLKAFRGRGVGRALVAGLEACAVRYWRVADVALHAQEGAVSFYAAAGYTVCSEVFFDGPGIPHRAMTKHLGATPAPLLQFVDSTHGSDDSLSESLCDSEAPRTPRQPRPSSIQARRPESSL